MKSLLLLAAVFALMFHSALPAQSLSIRPYIGYAQVRMEEVNEDVRRRIGSLGSLVQQPLPFPEEFNGNIMGGIQLDYHADTHYFTSFNIYYYQEKIGIQEANQDYSFETQRKYRLLEFSLGFKYFFSYASWRRWSPYLGVAAGYAMGWSDVALRYEDAINGVDNYGDFSSGALTATFGGGIALRINSVVSFYPEFGYRVANLQQMEGTLSVTQNFPGVPNGQISAVQDNYLTEFNNDFSGFYLSLGLNMVLPFWK